jgi:hypothetical protein
MSRILMIMLQDGLQTSSGFVAQAPRPCLIYCKVPDDWVEGDIEASSELWLKGPTLKADKLEHLFETLYGKTWRYGNSDGSQYVVLRVGARLLNPRREMPPPDEEESKRYQLFYYAVGEDDQFHRASP